MLITGFPAGSFAANCYLVAPEPGAECVIIDPGEGAGRRIEEIVADHRLKPVAVLLTHGHIDHVWSVAPVCGARGIPAYIHPDDRALLSDPARGLPLGAGQQLFGGLEFTEPDDVRELTDGTVLNLAGLEIVVNHAPGHTPGSVVFHSDPAVMFSGDLLFAGSIGRTDLPGGDTAAMMDSLARVCLTRPDRDTGAARPRPADDHRCRTGQQSVPGRAGTKYRAARAGTIHGAVMERLSRK